MEGSPSSGGILRGLSFKKKSDLVDNERSSLFKLDPNAGAETPILRDIVSSISWSRCTSLPVRPASNLSPKVFTHAPARGQVTPLPLEQDDKQIPKEEAACTICLDLCEAGNTLKMECSCKEVKNLPVSLLRFPSSAQSDSRQEHTNQSLNSQSIRSFSLINTLNTLHPVMLNQTLYPIMQCMGGLGRSCLDWHNIVLLLPEQLLEAPAIVKSVYNKRIVGCPGGEDEDEHDVVWFWLEKGKPHECPVCTQYLMVVSHFTVERLESACSTCTPFLHAHRISQCQLHDFIGDSEIATIVINESEAEGEEASNMHDASLSLSIHTTCARLMLNLVEAIFEKGVDPSSMDEARILLV